MAEGLKAYKKMKHLIGALILGLGLHAPAYAFFIAFDDGTEGATVTDIPGVSFQSFNGFDALYGDCRAGYNCTSDDLGYGGGSYHHNGNFFLWAGPDASAQGAGGRSIDAIAARSPSLSHADHRAALDAANRVEVALRVPDAGAPDLPPENL